MLPAQVEAAVLQLVRNRDLLRRATIACGGVAARRSVWQGPDSDVWLSGASAAAAMGTHGEARHAPVVDEAPCVGHAEPIAAPSEALQQQQDATEAAGAAVVSPSVSSGGAELARTSAWRVQQAPLAWHVARGPSALTARRYAQQAARPRHVPTPLQDFFREVEAGVTTGYAQHVATDMPGVFSRMSLPPHSHTYDTQLQQSRSSDDFMASESEELFDQLSGAQIGRRTAPSIELSGTGTHRQISPSKPNAAPHIPLSQHWGQQHRQPPPSQASLDTPVHSPEAAAPSLPRTHAASPSTAASLPAVSQEPSPRPDYEYSHTLSQGYQQYLSALRRAAEELSGDAAAPEAGGLSIPGSPQVAGLAGAPHSASPAEPSFEEYARCVDMEMRSRELALVFEQTRMVGAAKRGSLSEMPSALRLLRRWRGDLAKTLREDQMLLAKLLTQREGGSPTYADGPSHRPVKQPQQPQQQQQQQQQQRSGAPMTSGGSSASGDKAAGQVAAVDLPPHRVQYSTLLYSLPPEVLAETTTQVVTAQLLQARSGSVPFSRAALAVGDAVLDKLRHMRLCARLLEEKRNAITQQREARRAAKQIEKLRQSDSASSSSAAGATVAPPSGVATAAGAQARQSGVAAQEGALTEVGGAPSGSSADGGSAAAVELGYVGAPGVPIARVLQLEQQYLERLKKAEQAYRIAEASLQRLKRLASKFDTRRPAMRHNLVESVDTLLQLEAWSSEQSVQVGGELLHALFKSAHVETAAPSQHAQPGLLGASDPPHGSSSSWSQPSEHSLAASPSSPVPFDDDPTAHSASPRLQPAFVHDLVPDHGPAGAAGPGARGGGGGAARVVGMFGLSDQALVQLLQGDLTKALFSLKPMPMLIPPRPWSHYKRGGQLTLGHPIARCHSSQLAMMADAHSRGELRRLYAAMNVLGQVPWRINRRVLAVMEQLAGDTGGADQRGVGDQLLMKLQNISDSMVTETRQHSAGHGAAAGAARGVGAGAGAATWTRSATPRTGPDTAAAAAVAAGPERAAQSAAPGNAAPGLGSGAGAASGPKPLDPELLGLAVHVGLPQTPEPMPPLHLYCPASTPYLRLSREGAARGQLLLSSGPPLPRESTALRAAWSKERQLRQDMLSIKSFFLLRLHVAQELRDAPRLFFPHNLDFRGRAYPMHPYLHHMGDDVSRGLLTFADGKPLGQHGLAWLFTHIANMWGKGVDKQSLQERVHFTEENLKEVLDSAVKPLTGGRWWAQGEKPWQLLAACFEVHAALTSGNPQEYCSTLPVHQDGSCNGLQHYAALSRDRVCAAEVNMLPAPLPGDVYSAVARAVTQRVQRDAAAGMSEALKVLERNSGTIDRKLVKQTVMTTVYGVTQTGAREQISNRLRERGWSNEPEIFQVAQYLASSTFDCISQVFANANAVKEWLRRCAQTVAATGSAVHWNTPLGLPVLQPYVRPNPVQVRTSLQSVTLHAHQPVPYATVHAKTSDASAPCDSLSSPSAAAQPRHSAAAQASATPASASIANAANTGREAAVAHSAGGLGTSTGPVAASHGSKKVAPPTVASGGQGHALPQQPALDARIVDRMAQTSAFPPNYIHSLDASHMMMTAIECRRHGIAFAGVHDSFWTHAGTVRALGVLVRHTFVQLHSQPLLEQLLGQLQGQLDAARQQAADAQDHLRRGQADQVGAAAHGKPLAPGPPASAGPGASPGVPERKLPPMPAKGDLQLSEVTKAVYFFS